MDGIDKCLQLPYDGQLSIPIMGSEGDHLKPARWALWLQGGGETIKGNDQSQSI